jgi:pimeloyl-ACP methyl ester carboxylesterase
VARKTKEKREYRRGPLKGVWPSPARAAPRRAARRADEAYGASAEPSWRGIDWPAHTHRAVVDGREVNYVSLGEGSGDAQPVVFIHGLGGSWQNWLENMPAIAETRRVVALDLPGFGGSETPAEPISITLFARTVEALAEQLDLGHVAVVGNSMGGFTAAETAIRHPDRVERLVLVDAAGISIAEAGKVAQRVGRILVSGGGREIPDPLRVLKRPGFLQIAFGAVMRHPTLIQRDLLAEQLTAVGAPGFAASLEALLSYDFRDRLPEIEAPTLVVQGEDDVLVPLGDAREFERRIPRATSLVLEDTGHVPMLERPATFNRALLEFLDTDVEPDEPDPGEEPLLAEGAERPV